MDLGSLGLSLTDPLGSAGQDIVGWLGHAISQGIGSFASWSINGVIGAMQSTTTPDFTSWFEGPWRAMLVVVAWLSVPILFVGVGTAALRGDLTSVIKRGLGAPVVMAIGTAVALPVTAGVLTLVNACCQLLVNASIGGNQGFGQGLSHLSDFALSATAQSGGSALPGLAGVLIVVVAGLAALCIWFVLALRGAILYLEVLAIPLALCGLYWGGTAHWIKRLVDLIIATVISQLVITMLMVLAAADLSKNDLTTTSTGGQDLTTLFLSVGFLLLGSLALPIALKHVPAATEHATTAASQISGPGRMAYMGSRMAGSARMMAGGRGGGQAVVGRAAAVGGAAGVAAVAGQVATKVTGAGVRAAGSVPATGVPTANNAAAGGGSPAHGDSGPGPSGIGNSSPPTKGGPLGPAGSGRAAAQGAPRQRTMNSVQTNSGTSDRPRSEGARSGGSLLPGTPPQAPAPGRSHSIAVRKASGGSRD